MRNAPIAHDTGCECYHVKAARESEIHGGKKNNLRRPYTEKLVQTAPIPTRKKIGLDQRSNFLLRSMKESGLEQRSNFLLQSMTVQHKGGLGKG